MSSASPRMTSGTRVVDRNNSRIRDTMARRRACPSPHSTEFAVPTRVKQNSKGTSEADVESKAARIPLSCCSSWSFRNPTTPSVSLFLELLKGIGIQTHGGQRRGPSIRLRFRRLWTAFPSRISLRIGARTLAPRFPGWSRGTTSTNPTR